MFGIGIQSTQTLLGAIGSKGVILFLELKA
jgi:hypothetical protein